MFSCYDDVFMASRTIPNIFICDCSVENVYLPINKKIEEFGNLWNLLKLNLPHHHINLQVFLKMMAIAKGFYYCSKDCWIILAKSSEFIMTMFLLEKPVYA